MRCRIVYHFLGPEKGDGRRECSNFGDSKKNDCNDLIVFCSEKTSINLEHPEMNYFLLTILLNEKF